MNNINKLVLIMLFICLQSCVSRYPILLKNNTESDKLDTRMERWKNAEKCLKAMSSVNGRIEALCESNQDIYDLASEIGIGWANVIVKEHLNTLEYYDKQLNDKIIDKLPPDEPMTNKVKIDFVKVTYEDNKNQITLFSNESKTCIYRSQLGEIDYESCQSEVNSRYKSYGLEQKAGVKKVIEALSRFEANYQPSP